MNIVFHILVLLLLLSSSVDAATINAVSCSQADVSSAISSAAVGDTVNVPAGSCSWSGLSITKGINLIGAGIDNTIITVTGTSTYDPTDYSLDTPFRLSGFSFNGASIPSGGRVLSLGILGKHPPFTIQTQVRIDHNEFYGKPESSQYTYIYDRLMAAGVIDHNTFVGGMLPIRHHSGTDEHEGWWTTAPQNTWSPGSSTGMYIENNTFDVSGSTDVQIADTAYVGGRYIYRYNLITGGSQWANIFDMHGNHGTTGVSSNGSFGGEIYGNRIEFGSAGVRLYSTRGGKSFVFLNSVETSGLSNQVYSTTTPGADAVCAPSNSYPERQVVHDTYFWGNRIGYTGSLGGAASPGDDIKYECAGFSGRPLEGRDFFDDTSSPGVSMGTLANLPANCTTGQGYWATSQSTSDLTGMVGLSPSNPISGTFYKCTSTDTWTGFYTPYTYPHPLVGGGGTSITPWPMRRGKQ